MMIKNEFSIVHTYAYTKLFKFRAYGVRRTWHTYIRGITFLMEEAAAENDSHYNRNRLLHKNPHPVSNTAIFSSKMLKLIFFIQGMHFPFSFSIRIKFLIFPKERMRKSFTVVIKSYVLINFPLFPRWNLKLQ